MCFLDVKKILVIEDDEDLSDTYSYWFKDSGIEILRVYDGLSALNLINEEHQNIDMIILDYNIPILNGLDVIIELKKKKISIPTLLVSGYSDEFLKYVSFHSALTKQTIDEVLVSLKIQILDKPIMRKGDLINALVKLFDTHLMDKVNNSYLNLISKINTEGFYGK